MSRPPGQLPALQRAIGKNGQRIGSYFLWTRDDASKKYSRINLATKDEAKARRRRTEAMGGRRVFVYDDDEPAPAPAAPAPAIPIIPSSHQLGPVEGSHWQPIVLPPEPAPLAQGAAEPAPSIAPETPQSDTDWTRDAARAAGAPDVESSTPSEPENKGAPAPAAPAQVVDDGQVRIKDLAEIGPVFVTASRIVVQLQIALHVLIARYLFKTELDPIREEVPKDVVGFMKAQGEKWPDTDPREPGRAMWEKFGRRICPDNLVLPDWALAPALVAAGTLPIQVANRKPVAPALKPHVPVVPSRPSEPPQSTQPPEPSQPAPEPTAPEPARSRHVPVMPDMS